MPAEVKVKLVEELRDKFGRAESVILADYRGLTVADMNDLRGRCREAGVEIRVAKNRLAKRALRDLEVSSLDDLLVGPTIFALGYEDPVTPAKVLADYAKDNSILTLKGGLVGKEAQDAAAVKTLASLPSREELLARLAGSLASPMRNLASALSQIPGGLARALQAVADQKQAA